MHDPLRVVERLAPVCMTRSGSWWQVTAGLHDLLSGRGLTVTRWAGRVPQAIPFLTEKQVGGPRREGGEGGTLGVQGGAAPPAGEAPKAGPEAFIHSQPR